MEVGSLDSHDTPVDGSEIRRENHLSNENNLGWKGYIGDEILPSYIGITKTIIRIPINHPV